MINNLKHFFIIPFILGIIGGFAAILFRWLIKFFVIVDNKLDFFHNSYFYLITIPLVFFISDYLIRKFNISPENVTLELIAKKVIILKGKFLK